MEDLREKGRDEKGSVEQNQKQNEAELRLDHKLREKKTGEIWHSVCTWLGKVRLTDREKKETRETKKRNEYHTLQGKHDSPTGLFVRFPDRLA